jgi:hypothetical protein
MQRRCFKALLIIGLAAFCKGCLHKEAVEPKLTADQTRLAMSGNWKIEKVDYQVCRSGNCTNRYYIGAEADYFEFRADSAFLVYNTALGNGTYNAYKADYCLPGAFILNQEFWKLNVELKDYKPDKVVLVCTYTGQDPYARFTDVYYLYR